MNPVFHCYEYLLLKRLEEDPELWESLKTKFLKEKGKLFKLQVAKPISIKSPSIPSKPSISEPSEQKEIISSDLWFLAITLEKTRDRFPSFVRSLAEVSPSLTSSVPENLLSRYLNSCDFVELHLDSIFKYGEGAVLPIELFKCPNVKVLSLKYNYLENLPPDVGRLQKLQYLALTNNRLQNSSIPYTLTFCRNLQVLLLDHNLLDALPGFLLTMPSLQTVHRHGNHNYFKATFMWYHTDVNDRILYVVGSPAGHSQYNASTLQFLAARTVIASKINFYASQTIPQMLMDYVSSIYFKFSICGNCPKAKLQTESGYKVYTFKNPYLGNTCVPFQHWACSYECAEAIEIPARVEQILSALEQDRQYDQYIQEAQDQCPCSQRHNSGFPLGCCLF